MNPNLKFLPPGAVDFLCCCSAARRGRLWWPRMLRAVGVVVGGWGGGEVGGGLPQGRSSHFLLWETSVPHSCQCSQKPTSHICSPPFLCFLSKMWGKVLKKELHDDQSLISMIFFFIKSSPLKKRLMMIPQSEISQKINVCPSVSNTISSWNRTSSRY